MKPTGLNIQDEPESTIGKKPGDFQHPEQRASPEEETVPLPQSAERFEFARSRERREEAEESDIGREIRERELGEPEVEG